MKPKRFPKTTGANRVGSREFVQRLKRARQVLSIYNRWRRAEGVWADRTYDDMPFRDADIGHAIAAGNAAMESVDDLLTFFFERNPARTTVEKRMMRHLRRLSLNNKVCGERSSPAPDHNAGHARSQ